MPAQGANDENKNKSRKECITQRKIGVRRQKTGVSTGNKRKE